MRLVSSPLLLCIGRAELSAAACSSSSTLRESFTRPLSSKPSTLTLTKSPAFLRVGHRVNALVRDLADVQQAVATRQQLDHSAEIHDADDRAFVDLSTSTSAVMSSIRFLHSARSSPFGDAIVMVPSS